MRLVQVVALGLLLLAAVRASDTESPSPSAAFAADDDAPVVAMVADDIARSWSDMVDQYQGGKQQQLPDGSLLFPADLMLVMQRHSEDDVVNALRQAQRRDEEAKQQADGKDVLVFLEKELEFIEPDAAGSKDFGDADASFQEPEGKGVVVVLEKDNLPESRRQDDLSSILALFESMGLTGSSATSTTSTTTAAPPPEQSPDAGNAELLDVLRLIDTGALGTLESMGLQQHVRRHPRDVRLITSPAAGPAAPAPHGRQATPALQADYAPQPHAAPAHYGGQAAPASQAGFAPHAAPAHQQAASAPQAAFVHHAAPANHGGQAAPAHHGEHAAPAPQAAFVRHAALAPQAHAAFAPQAAPVLQVAHDAHAARAPAPNFTHTAPAAPSSQQHPAVGAAVEATPAAFNASSIGDVNLSGVKDSDAREVMDSLTKGLLQVDTPPPPTVDVDKQDDLPAVGPVEALRMVHITSQAPANDKKPQENVHVPSTTPAWVVNTPADPPVQVVKFVPVNGTPATPEPEPIDLVRFATKLGQSGVGEALEEIQKDDETLPGMTRILFPQGMYVDPSTNQPSHHVSKKDQTQQEKAAVQDKSFKTIEATAKKINLGGKDSKYEKKPVSVAKLDASKPVHEKLDVIPYMVESNDNPSPVVAPLQEEPLKAVEEDPISLKFPAPIGNLDDVRDLLNMNVTFADEQPTSPPTPRPSPQPGGGDRAATESAPTSSKQADRPLLGKLDKLLNFAKEIASLGPLQPGTTDVHVHGGRASPSATSAHSAASTTSRPVTSTSAPASDPAGPTTATAEPQGPVGQAEDPLARNADLSSSTTAKQAYLNRAVQFPLRDWHDIGAARSARGSFSEVEQPKGWLGAAPTDPAKPSDGHAADDAQLFAVPPPPSATPTDDSGVVHPQASPSPTQEAAPPNPESTVLTDEDLHFEIQDLTTTPDPTKKKKKKKKKGFRLPFLVPTTTKAPWPRSLANLAPFLPFPEDSQIRPPTLIRRPHFKPPPHAPWKHHDHGHDYSSGHDHQHGHSHAYGHNHGYKYSVEVATLPPLPADDPVQQPWYYPSQMDYSSGYQGQPATYQQTAYQQAAQPTYQQAAYLQTAYQQPTYQQAATQQEAFPQPANQQAAYQQSNYQQAAYQQAANQLNTYQHPDNQQVTYQQAEYQQAANQQVAYQQPANQQIAYQEAGYQQAANQQVAYQQAGYQQAANQQVAYEQPANQQAAYQQAGYRQATDQQDAYQQPANQEAAYQHTANQQDTYQYPANQLTAYNQDATAASHPEQKPTSATQPFEQQAALESDVIQPPPVYTQGVYQDGGYAQAEYGPVAYQPDVFQPQYEPGAYGAEGAQGPYGVQQEQPLAFYQPPTYESPSNYVHQQRRRRSPDTGAALTADTHDVAGDAEEGADKQVDTMSFADAVPGEKAAAEKETEGAVPDVEDIASKRVLAEQSPSLAEEPEATSFNEKETADGLLLSDEERSIKNVASLDPLDPLPSVDKLEQTALDPADKMNEQIAVVSAPRADSVVDDIEAAMPATEDVHTGAANNPQSAAIANPVDKQDDPAAEETAPRAPAIAEAAEETAPRSPIIAEAAEETAPRSPIIAEAAEETAPRSPMIAEAAEETAFRAPAVAELVEETAPQASAVAEVAEPPSPAVDEPDPLADAAADFIIPVDVLSSMIPPPRPHRRLHHPHRFSPLHPGADADAPQLARKARQHDDAVAAQPAQAAQAQGAAQTQVVAHGPYPHHHPHLPPAMEDLIPKIGETEAEKAEREQKAVQRMIQVVNVLGSLQNFLSGRAKTIVRRLSKIVDEEEGEKLTR